MISETDVAEWIHARVQAQGTVDPDMGSLERVVDCVTREVRRRALERLTQEAAAREAFGCPACGDRLNVVRHRQGRTVQSAFGPVRFERSYGLCAGCGRHSFPADAALGLHERAPCSPRLQEICALMTLQAPAGRAEEDVRRITGLDISASTLHREARRQGERALKLRCERHV